MFKLKINTRNDAFQEDASAEVVNILEDVIVRLKAGSTGTKFLIDFYGNNVGEFTLNKR